MAYTTNPKLPRLRMQAVTMVRKGSSTRSVARYFGYNQSTIVRWVNKADEELLKGSENLPTQSSCPKSHPRALAPDIVTEIIAERIKHNRCAEVVHDTLMKKVLLCHFLALNAHCHDTICCANGKSGNVSVLE